MNMNHISTGRFALALGVSVMALGTMSCKDEPDKYEHTDGVPAIEYVRSTDPAAADSLLTGAYLSNTVCLRGENLRSIHEIYFNDQKAILNTSLITDNSLIVDVPSKIPARVTDTMYLINWTGDTIKYPFKSLVPAPKGSSMSCEWAPAGSKATIYGDFFVNDPSFKMTLTDSEGNAANIESLDQNSISFTVPDNWKPGYLTLTTIYGKSKSKFRYKDDLNILFDFDGTRGGQPGGNGWHSAKTYDNLEAEGVPEVTPIDGKFMAFIGDTYSEESNGAGASEDNSGMEYWTDFTPEHPRLSEKPDFADILKRYDWTDLQVKFEMCVPASRPWKSTALRIMFTDIKTVSSNNANNLYRYETDAYEGVGYPRCTYQPYADLKASGYNFNTADEWITVTIPLSSFRFNRAGQAMTKLYTNESFDGMTMCMDVGGDAGAECSPVICFDNIRVVPIE